MASLAPLESRLPQRRRKEPPSGPGRFFRPGEDLPFDTSPACGDNPPHLPLAFQSRLDFEGTYICIYAPPGAAARGWRTDFPSFSKPCGTSDAGSPSRSFPPGFHRPMISISPCQSAADRRLFERIPEMLHGSDPCFVPPFPGSIAKYLSPKSVFNSRHGEIIAFIDRRRGVSKG